VSHDRFRFGLVALAYIVSILFFVRLPALVGRGVRMPVLDFARIATSFVLPTAVLAIVLIFRSLAKRDPFRANYEKFRRTYEISLDLAILLAVGTHFLLLASMLILRGLVGRWISYVPTALLGVIFVVAGNILPRLRPNYAMGIRTRWTLADETVWMKTHRVGGYALVVFGLVLVVWTFADFMGIWRVLGPGLILAAAGLPLLSLVYAKRIRRLQPPPPKRLDEKERTR
jgi:uncharacterized membrane protein